MAIVGSETILLNCTFMLHARALSQFLSVICTLCNHTNLYCFVVACIYIMYSVRHYVRMKKFIMVQPIHAHTVVYVGLYV